MLKAVTSEDELAAVLSHEIGHDQFGHIPKTVTRQFFWMTGVKKVGSQAEIEKDLTELFLAYDKNNFAAVGERLLGWSRNDELQADKAGFYTMYKAGYNPEAMKNVFRHYLSKEKASSNYDSDYFFTLLFGSHPPSSQRVTALKWESIWIKMPEKTESYKSDAFEAMKTRVKMM
jgi:beta-barrel assembly-enhancing protease